MKFVILTHKFKLIFILCLFVTLCIIDCTYKSLNKHKHKKRHFKHFNSVQKMYKNANPLLEKLKSVFPKWFEKYRYLKEHPEALGKLGHFKILSPKDPSAENFDSSKNEILDELIQEKNEILNQVLLKYPDLSEIQKFKIGYFIGSRTQAQIKYFRQKAVLDAINNFIKATTKDDLDPEYTAFINKLIFMNTQNASKVLQDVDKIQMSIYLDYQEQFNNRFLRNDLELFKGWNCRCPDKVESGKNGLPKKFRFLQKKIKRNNHNSKFHNLNRAHFLSKNNEVQFYLEATRKNIESINKKVKNTLGWYEAFAKEIKSNELLSFLKGAVKKIDDTKIPSNLKNTINKVTIITTSSKILQGKIEAKDVIFLVDQLSSYLGIKELKKPLDVAKNLLEIKSHINALSKATTPSKTLSELLLIVGNLSAISPVPMHKKIGSLLTLTANEINATKAVQNIVDEYVEKSLDNFNKEYQELRLTYVSQFYSDFAIDDMRYNSIELKQGLKDIFEEKKNKSSENYEKIKKSFKGITEVMEEMNERFYKSAEEGRIDKYANSFNNFDSGFEYDVPFGIVDVLQTYITPRDTNEGSIFGQLNDLYDFGEGLTYDKQEDFDSGSSMVDFEKFENDAKNSVEDGVSFSSFTR
jgi:hypothetical protein